MPKFATAVKQLGQELRVDPAAIALANLSFLKHKNLLHVSSVPANGISADVRAAVELALQNDEILSVSTELIRAYDRQEMVTDQLKSSWPSFRSTVEKRVRKKSFAQDGEQNVFFDVLGEWDRSENGFLEFSGFNKGKQKVDPAVFGLNVEVSRILKPEFRGIEIADLDPELMMQEVRKVKVCRPLNNYRKDVSNLF